jgi:hypothetical protein
VSGERSAVRTAEYTITELIESLEVRVGQSADRNLMDPNLIETADNGERDKRFTCEHEGKTACRGRRHRGGSPPAADERVEVSRRALVTAPAPESQDTLRPETPGR